MAQPLLDELLCRLDWHTPQADILDWDEVDQWPPDFLRMLLKAGALVPIQPATSVICDACAEGHVAEVYFVPSPEGAQDRAYIACLELGPVEVELERLQRWQSRLEGISALCGITIGAPPARVVQPGRLIDLGVLRLSGLLTRTFLGRGLAWHDAPGLLDEVRSAAGDAESVVLVPSEAPRSAHGNLRIVPLLGNLVQEGGAVHFRLPSLRSSNSAPTPETHLFRKHGAAWQVTFDGRTAFIKHTLGMQYLSYLLAKPHIDFRATGLVALVRGSTPPEQMGSEYESQALGIDEGGDAGEVIDAAARDAYRDDYKRLTSDLKEARDSGDSERVEQLLVQVKWLVKQLSEGIRLDGKPRLAKATGDRARIGVTKAINTAAVNVAAQLPSLGEHFKAAVHTGASCCYRPADIVTWEC
ncbi:MAG: hypothetical protein GEU75_16955 [Dehalococcoidia bacterium]|nr:hypothetical protein [Dehalococcoidia bacterium]